MHPFLNDLVEAQIVPIAIFPDEAANYSTDFLLQAPNQLLIGSGVCGHNSVVRIHSSCTRRLAPGLSDAREQMGVGFFPIEKRKNKNSYQLVMPSYPETRQ